jgi:hypothetical protein
MLYSLTEDEFHKIAKKALIRICGSDQPNPYVTPFTSRMHWKRILCPYDHLPDDELMVVISMLAKENFETGFYLSVYDRPPENSRLFPYHWYIPYDELESYKDKIGHCKELPTIIYSPCATWGIISDVEGMGVIGVIERFESQLESKLCKYESDVFEFIKLFKWFRGLAESRKGAEKVDFGWLPELLVNVYGDELASRYLRNSLW